jgi:thiamine-phosphate pyrophosphorylase
VSRETETIDPAEAGCRLFLISPQHVEPASLARDLDAALGSGKVAGFLLRAEALEGRAEAVRSLQPVCRAHEVAFLIADDLDLALEVGADGLHLSAARGAAEARAKLGDERLLGVACDLERHAAMVAGEAGADYVAFGEPGRAVDAALEDMIAWCSGLFVLPCLALGRIDRASCAALVRAGADFLGVADAVWAHPAGASAGVAELERAIAES